MQFPNESEGNDIDQEVDAVYEIAKNQKLFSNRQGYAAAWFSEPAIQRAAKSGKTFPYQRNFQPFQPFQPQADNV